MPRDWSQRHIKELIEGGAGSNLVENWVQIPHPDHESNFGRLSSVNDKSHVIVTTDGQQTNVLSAFDPLPTSAINNGFIPLNGVISATVKPPGISTDAPSTWYNQSTEYRLEPTTDFNAVIITAISRVSFDDPNEHIYSHYVYGGRGGNLLMQYTRSNPNTGTATSPISPFMRPFTSPESFERYTRSNPLSVTTYEHLFTDEGHFSHERVEGFREPILDDHQSYMDSADIDTVGDPRIIHMTFVWSRQRLYDGWADGVLAQMRGVLYHTDGPGSNVADQTPADSHGIPIAFRAMELFEGETKTIDDEDDPVDAMAVVRTGPNGSGIEDYRHPLE